MHWILYKYIVKSKGCGKQVRNINKQKEVEQFYVILCELWCGASGSCREMPFV